jgi:hypothetical protein
MLALILHSGRSGAARAALHDFSTSFQSGLHACLVVFVVYQHSVGRLRVHRGAMPSFGGKITMHDAIHAEIMKARTVDAHREADRARVAAAVRQSRPALRWEGARRLLPRLRLRPVLRRLAGGQAGP